MKIYTLWGILLFSISYYFYRKSKKKVQFQTSLVLIDALSLNALFNLNFYKLFAIEAIISKEFWSNTVTKIFVALFCLSAIMAIISHFFFPNLTPPFETGFVNTIPIRILRNQSTLFLELAFSFLIYRSLKKDSEGLDNILNAIILSGFLVALGMLMEFIFKFDFYHALSGGRELVFGQKDYFRLRGFAYEPRGAAQVIALSIFACSIQLKSIKFVLASLIQLTALFFTYSISGSIITFALIVFLLIAAIFKNRKEIVVKIIFIFAAGSSLLIFSTNNQQLKVQIKEKSFIIATNESQYLVDRFIAKFEVLDSSYLNFLKNHPGFLITGAGSGMGGIISQNYILPKDRITFPAGASGTPLMGIWYFHAQFGFLGFLFLTYIFFKNTHYLIHFSDTKNFLLWGGLILFWILSHRYVTIFLYAYIYYCNDKISLFPSKLSMNMKKFLLFKKSSAQTNIVDDEVLFQDEKNSTHQPL